MERGDLKAFDLSLARLEAEDLETTPVEELGNELVRFEDVSRRLEAERSRRLGEFDSRSGHDVLGYPSPIAFLKDRCRISGGRARRMLGMARTSRRFKATFLSWKHDQISTDQAQELFRASEQMPDKYPDAEPVLLEIAGHTPEETKKTLDYWRHTVDQPGVLIDESQQLHRRRLDYTRKANGMIEGEFAFTQMAGETFITAIEALMPPPAAGDDRTASQRRADGAEDLARAFLEGTETSVVGGEKPHLNIHVDIEAIDGKPGGLHETETGQVLTMATVRQLSCDASISRIVWNSESEIIDVGRKTRVIPAATRRAVIARDRHCVGAGCTRSPRWADVHHIVHWADGGETDLSNLCLLCRYHHTLIHEDEEFEQLILEQLELDRRRRSMSG